MKIGRILYRQSGPGPLGRHNLLSELDLLILAYIRTPVQTGSRNLVFFYRVRGVGALEPSPQRTNPYVSTPVQNTGWSRNLLIAFYRVRRAGVGKPPQHVRVALHPGGLEDSPLVPRARVLPGEPEHVRVPPPRGRDGRGLVPRTAVLPRPPEDGEPPLSRSRGARLWCKSNRHNPAVATTRGGHEIEDSETARAATAGLTVVYMLGWKYPE